MPIALKLAPAMKPSTDQHERLSGRSPGVRCGQDALFLTVRLKVNHRITLLRSCPKASPEVTGPAPADANPGLPITQRYRNSDTLACRQFSTEDENLFVSLLSTSLVADHLNIANPRIGHLFIECSRKVLLRPFVDSVSLIRCFGHSGYTR